MAKGYLGKLPLDDVVYSDTKMKATLIFLDVERGEIREVNFNKEKWDDEASSFVYDEEKEAKVEEWCEKYFGKTFDTLHEAIGTELDLYGYPTFNSLWESEIIEKFTKDEVGQLYQCEITDITVDNIGIHIKFKYNDAIYKSKMGYSDYREELEKWFIDRQKERKQLAKFENKFHVPVDKCEELIGETIMVEVKLAFGKFVYADIKPLPKK
jgi:hypothetical protein